MVLVQDQLEQARHHIPNLRVVSETLVRGGQPEPDGLHALKAAGVKTVISLCGGTTGLVGLLRGSSRACREDPETVQERAVSAKIGLEYIAIPLDVFSEPPAGAIDQFLEIARNVHQHAIFLHCLHGRDRTGLLSAVYRVVIDGWTAEKAYAEMLECGFDPGRTNLSDTLFAVAKRQQAK